MQIRLSNRRCERTGLEDGLDGRADHPTLALRTDLGLQLVQAAQKRAHGLLMPSLDGGRRVDELAPELDGLLGWRGIAITAWS